MTLHPWVRRVPGVFSFVVLTSACGGSDAVRTETPEESVPAPRLTIALRFVPGEEEDIQRISTRVLLVRIDQEGTRDTTDLGDFPGVCNHLPLRPRALLRVRCGWLDQKVELLVTRRGDDLVAIRSSATEQAQHEIAHVRLPENAVIDALHPETLPVE